MEDRDPYKATMHHDRLSPINNHLISPRLYINSLNKRRIYLFHLHKLFEARLRIEFSLFFNISDIKKKTILFHRVMILCNKKRDLVSKS